MFQQVASAVPYPFNLAICRAERSGYHHAGFELSDEQTFERARKAVADERVIIEEQVDLPWKKSFFLRCRCAG